MNEIKRKALLNKIDEDWLALAYELVLDEFPPVSLRKGMLLDQLLALKETEPYLLLFPLHQGILSLLLNHCGDKLGNEVSELEMARLRRNIVKDLEQVNDEDFMFHIPNDSLSSSAAFAEILVEEKIVPELLLEWNEEMEEVMSYIAFSMEMWNIINYYGAITMEDLVRIHASIYDEDDFIPEGALAAVLVYIQMNLSEDTYFDVIDGENWFMTEYGDIDPLEIIEDVRERQDMEYRILDRENLMNMIHGITPFELLKVFDWLTTTYHLEEEGEEMLGDINFLHSIVMEIRSRHGEEMPQFLHDMLGWEWEISDPEARDLIYQDLLHHMARFHLKGNSQAQLDGEEEEHPFFDLDDVEEEEELFFEDDMPEEFNFKLRKTKDDDDTDYLN